MWRVWLYYLFRASPVYVAMTMAVLHTSVVFSHHNFESILVATTDKCVHALPPWATSHFNDEVSQMFKCCTSLAGLQIWKWNIRVLSLSVTFILSTSVQVPKRWFCPHTRVACYRSWFKITNATSWLIVMNHALKMVLLILTAQRHIWNNLLVSIIW